MVTDQVESPCTTLQVLGCALSLGVVGAVLLAAGSLMGTALAAGVGLACRTAWQT